MDEIERLQEEIWRLQREKEARERRGDYGKEPKELHIKILKLEKRLRRMVESKQNR